MIQPKSFSSSQSPDHRREDEMHQYIMESKSINLVPFGYVRMFTSELERETNERMVIPNYLIKIIVVYYVLTDALVKSTDALLRKDYHWIMNNIQIHPGLLLYGKVKTNMKEVIIYGATKIVPSVFLNNNFQFEWIFKYNTNIIKGIGVKFILGIKNLKVEIERPPLIGTNCEFGAVYEVENAEDGDEIKMVLRLRTKNNYHQLGTLKILRKATSESAFKELWTQRIWDKCIGAQYPKEPSWVIYIMGYRLERKSKTEGIEEDKVHRSWTLNNFTKLKC